MHKTTAKDLLDPDFHKAIEKEKRQRFRNNTFDDIQDNIAVLNNMGHKKMVEDFSDSPFANK